MTGQSSRRTFLAASGTTAAAASVAFAAETATAAAEPAVRLKKSVKIGMVREGKTLLEKFKLLKEVGFDGVELDSPNKLKPTTF